MSTDSIAHAPLGQFGFRCDRRNVRPSQNVRFFIRRDEIALHLLEKGALRVVLATGDHFEMAPLQLTVTWGAIPHRVEWLKETTVLCQCIPLPWVLHWQLTAAFCGPLLAGHALAEADPAEGQHDQHMLRRWVELLAHPSDEKRRIVLLEIESRMRRLALNYQTTNRPPLMAEPNKIEQAIQLIAKRFADLPNLPALAAELGVHPSYLSTLFKRSTGQTLSHYITEYRLAYACGLLVSTTDKIIDIAYAAGFGSVSQFHTQFQRYRGCSPRRYRRAHHPQASG